MLYSGHWGKEWGVHKKKSCFVILINLNRILRDVKAFSSSEGVGVRFVFLLLLSKMMSGGNWLEMNFFKCILCSFFNGKLEIKFGNIFIVLNIFKWDWGGGAQNCTQKEGTALGLSKGRETKIMINFDYNNINWNLIFFGMTGRITFELKFCFSFIKQAFLIKDA